MQKRPIVDTLNPSFLELNPLGSFSVIHTGPLTVFSPQANHSLADACQLPSQKLKKLVSFYSLTAGKLPFNKKALHDYLGNVGKGICTLYVECCL